MLVGPASGSLIARVGIIVTRLLSNLPSENIVEDDEL